MNSTIKNIILLLVFTVVVITLGRKDTIERVEPTKNEVHDGIRRDINSMLIESYELGYFPNE